MIDNMEEEREYSFSLNERDIITEAVMEFVKILPREHYIDAEKPTSEMCLKIVRKLWANKESPE